MGRAHTYSTKFMNDKVKQCCFIERIKDKKNTIFPKLLKKFQKTMHKKWAWGQNQVIYRYIHIGMYWNFYSMENQERKKTKISLYLFLFQ